LKFIDCKFVAIAWRTFMNLRPSFRSLGRLVSTALLMVSCGAATMQAQAPTTAVGNTSAVQTATVTITTAGTLSKIAVLTQGATGLDYQAVTNGALLPCMVGVPYLVNETCTVQYTFSPTHPWVRYGGISLSSSSGALLGNLYLTGSGTAPQVSYPAGPTTVPATLTSAGNPNSVAVDGSGNLYFADAASGSVKEAAAVGGVVSPGAMISTVATGFTSPNAIAVDGSGNVFVLESGGAVKEIVATSGTVRTLATGFGAPLGIAVDASGDIFVTDTTAGSVREIAATNGVISATPAITTVTTAHVNPSGVAVDLAGDVFFTDSNLVKEIPSGGTVQTVATLAGANGLAVDVAGDLYVSDTANKAVYEILAVAGVIPASPTVVTLGTGFVGPNGLAVDAGGNVFVADMAGTPGFLKELNVSTPPTITFTSTAANTPSSDSPMTLTVGNNGTDPLVFAIPTTGTNPSPSAGFTVTAGPTITGGPTTRPATPCPQLTTASATTLSLAAGAACTDNISFDPAAIGAVTGTLTSTDNNLNATATQVVPLNGGLASPTITVTSTSAAVDTTSVTLTAVIAYNGLTPGGTFGFTVNGSATGVSGPNCEPTAGSTTTCTATLNAATAGLAVGTYPIVANLGADPSNNAATGSGTLTITIGTPVVSVGTSNASVAVDSPVTFTATVSPITGVTPTGAVSFTSTVGGVTTQIAGCGITSPVGINIATHMAACTTSALPAGSYTITANYGGDTNFNAASGTLAGTQTITLATPAVVLTTSNNSVVVNTPIIFTAAVTPTGGNVPSGKVSFSSTLAGTTTPIAACSGANAVAINGATHNATCTTSALAAGSYTITATVAADSNFNSATSNSLPQTVTLGTPVLTLPATGTPSLVNGPVSFTALVSPNAAGGFVPSSMAQQLLSPLAAERMRCP
jgi:sugar lactone lactonase YvrE